MVWLLPREDRLLAHHAERLLKAASLADRRLAVADRLVREDGSVLIAEGTAGNPALGAVSPSCLLVHRDLLERLGPIEGASEVESLARFVHQILALDTPARVGEATVTTARAPRTGRTACARGSGAASESARTPARAHGPRTSASSLRAIASRNSKPSSRAPGGMRRPPMADPVDLTVAVVNYNSSVWLRGSSTRPRAGVHHRWPEGPSRGGSW